MIGNPSQKHKECSGPTDWLLPESWRSWSKIVVLSPHSDDAAFSLAGHMFCLARSGKESFLVTCFSVSEFAPCATTDDVIGTTKLRKEEDLHYAAALGPTCRPVWLDFRDAPLRGYALQDLRHTGEFTAKEHALVKQILRRLDSILIPGCALFAPLGIGSHIDHRIVCEVGLSMARSGQGKILFYEEMPYAAEESERDIRRGVAALEEKLKGRLASSRSQGKILLEIKTLAAYCYPSQVRPERIQRMLSSGGPDVRCQSERVWEFLPGGRNFSSTKEISSRR